MRRPILMIVLLLLLLNAASLYWFTQRAPSGDGARPSPAALPEGVSRLQLASEVPPDQLLPVETKPTTAGTPAPTPPDTTSSAAPATKIFCFVTSPFPGTTIDDAVSGALADGDDAAVDTIPATIETTTYWVRLAGFKTRAEALSLLRDLRARGLSDVAVTRLKDHDAVVSLGLYSIEKSARDRVAEVRGMGFDADIAELERSRPALRYRVRMAAPNAPAAAGRLAAYRKAFPDHPVTTEACPE